MSGTVGRKIDAEIEAPLAFQSAIAGLLLATSLLTRGTDHGGNRLETVTRTNLLRPLAEAPNEPVGKHYRSACIYQDRDYLAVFRSKYGPGVP
jgi:hypothetical protein